MPPLRFQVHRAQNHSRISSWILGNLHSAKSFISPSLWVKGRGKCSLQEITHPKWPFGGEYKPNVSCSLRNFPEEHKAQIKLGYLFPGVHQHSPFCSTCDPFLEVIFLGRKALTVSHGLPPIPVLLDNLCGIVIYGTNGCHKGRGSMGSHGLCDTDRKFKLFPITSHVWGRRWQRWEDLGWSPSSPGGCHS